MQNVISIIFILISAESIVLNSYLNMGVPPWARKSRFPPKGHVFEWLGLVMFSGVIFFVGIIASYFMIGSYFPNIGNYLTKYNAGSMTLFLFWYAIFLNTPVFIWYLLHRKRN